MYTFLRLNIPEDAKLKKKHTLRKKQFLNLGLGFMSHSLLKNIKKKNKSLSLWLKPHRELSLRIQSYLLRRMDPPNQHNSVSNHPEGMWIPIGYKGAHLA